MSVRRRSSRIRQTRIVPLAEGICGSPERSCRDHTARRRDQRQIRGRSDCACVRDVSVSVARRISRVRKTRVVAFAERPRCRSERASRQDSRGRRDDRSTGESTDRACVCDIAVSVACRSASV